MKRLLILWIFTVMLLMFGQVPAVAADPLQVSTDGKTWSAALNSPLFVTPEHWVPGDQELRSFWVRNTTNQTGSLAIEAVGVDQGLFATGELIVQARVGSADWMDVEGASATNIGDLAGASEQQVEVRVEFLDSATNQSQIEQFELAFRVQLSGDGSLLGPDADSSDSAGPLTRTDGSLKPWVLRAAVGAILLGAVGVVVAGRRSKEEEL